MTAIDTSVTPPVVTLNDGVRIPQLGFGVWQVPDDQAQPAVETALRDGYRNIDTARIYGNEVGVGRAIAGSGIARDELFVTTKLWNDDQGYDSTLKAFDASLERLGLDYLDLYLIHWQQVDRGAYLDTFRAFQKLQADGRVRSIGVSNFTQPTLTTLIDTLGQVPSINQIEVHPYFQQRALHAFDVEHGIVTEAWSPLGSGAVLGDPAIGAIAAELGVSPAQVILRWDIQKGFVTIPKSVTPERIAQNFDIFGFELSEEQIARIDGLDRADGRTGPNPDTF
ncbi:aldo/keto reductase [Millisia brevis]|uniref:aldo/keto reductase n=1 Tax=Millisia brevis TaxID=264148 RepID=UPI000832F413|nr:aldo/keto reductase [Millisia brevis]